MIPNLKPILWNHPGPYVRGGLRIFGRGAGVGRVRVSVNYSNALPCAISPSLYLFFGRGGGGGGTGYTWHTCTRRFVSLFFMLMCPRK